LTLINGNGAASAAPFLLGVSAQIMKL